MGALKKLRFPSSGAPESPSESTAEAPDAVNVSQEDTVSALTGGFFSLLTGKSLCLHHIFREPGWLKKSHS